MLYFQRLQPAGSAPDAEECSIELQYGADYPVNLDNLSQREALMSLYNATGGPYWSWQDPVGETKHDLFFALIAEVIQLGEGFWNPSMLNSSLVSTLTASDLAELQALSVNCTLQQALSFGQLLLKHDWGEPDRSYCSWHGRTARPLLLPCCSTDGCTGCLRLLAFTASALSWSRGHLCIKQCIRLPQRYRVLRCLGLGVTSVQSNAYRKDILPAWAMPSPAMLEQMLCRYHMLQDSRRPAQQLLHCSSVGSSNLSARQAFAECAPPCLSLSQHRCKC